MPFKFPPPPYGEAAERTSPLPDIPAVSSTLRRCLPPSDSSSSTPDGGATARSSWLSNISAASRQHVRAVPPRSIWPSNIPAITSCPPDGGPTPRSSRPSQIPAWPLAELRRPLPSGFQTSYPLDEIAPPISSSLWNTSAAYSSPFDGGVTSNSSFSPNITAPSSWPPDVDTTSRSIFPSDISESTYCPSNENALSLSYFSWDTPAAPSPSFDRGATSWSSNITDASSWLPDEQTTPRSIFPPNMPEATSCPPDERAFPIPPWPSDTSAASSCLLDGEVISKSSWSPNVTVPSSWPSDEETAPRSIFAPNISKVTFCQPDEKSFRISNWLPDTPAYSSCPPDGGVPHTSFWSVDTPVVSCPFGGGANPSSSNLPNAAARRGSSYLTDRDEIRNPPYASDPRSNVCGKCKRAASRSLSSSNEGPNPFFPANERFSKFLEDANAPLAVRLKNREIDAMIENLRQRIEKAIYVSKMHSIRIYGVKEKPYEDLNTVVIKTLKIYMDLEIQFTDIDECERLGQKSPKTILATFNYMNTKEAVMKRKRVLQGSTIAVWDDLPEETLKVLEAAMEYFGNACVSIDRGAVICYARNGRRLRFESYGDFQNYMKSGFCSVFYPSSDINE